MPVTQKQIAERMGLSQPLVAQALSGHPRVSEKTRSEVLEMARQMGYGATANGAARAMAARRHGTRPSVNVVGIMLSNFFEMAPVRELPFFKEILRGIEKAAHKRLVEISFCPVFPDRLPRLIVEGGVDAAVFLYCHPTNELAHRTPLNMPSLVVGDASPGDWCLMPDNYRGIYEVTQHLTALGHQHIAYLGSLTTNIAYDQRYRGYCDALKAAGLEVEPELVNTKVEPILESGAKAFRELHAKGLPFSAVVCYNDRSALGVIQAAQAAGLNVPGDISVTGFDGMSQADNGGRNITSVYFDREEMGRRLIDLVCEAGNTQEGRAFPGQTGSAPPAPNLLPIRLIVGDSTGPAPNQEQVLCGKALGSY